MKIEKLPSGSYRVRQQYKGKRYAMVFDHKPSQAEVSIKISELLTKADVSNDTFGSCAQSYIESKSNVLSPSTIKGYNSLLNKSIPDQFKDKKISELTQVDIQLVINDYAATHSPKTTRNLHCFISSVLGQFRPQMIINTTLPQRVVIEPNLPTLEDINRILEICTPQFHIALQLAMLGMRRSEICAATIDDLEGNTLHINKAMVTDTNNNWVIKTTKTAAGTRDIYLPDNLVNEIKETGCIYEGYPNSIYDALQNYQDKLGIEHFSLHALRHFYASYCHSKGMTDADIMASGGWKSEYTMKNIYRQSIKKNKEEMQKKIADGLFAL